MADPRDLPEGVWTTARSKPKRRAADDVLTFAVSATDEVHDDRVVGIVAVGELTDYTHADWGLPLDLPLDRVWHLGRIEPRPEKALGGTKALVRYLCLLADQANVWLTTEVKTGDHVRDRIVLDLFAKYGEFEFQDKEYEALLYRRPRSRRTDQDQDV